MLSQRGVGCLTIPSHDEPTVGHNRIGRTETFVLESSQSRVLHTTYLPPLIFLPHFQNRRLKRRWVPSAMAGTAQARLVFQQAQRALKRLHVPKARQEEEGEHLRAGLLRR
jgi:hypothetical protein